MNINQIDEKNQKIQYALYGVTGSLYKQGFAKNYKSFYKLHKRHSKEYGGYLAINTLVVPISQTWHSAIPKEKKQYCFCPHTPLFVLKCEKCGLSPYTE